MTNRESPSIQASPTLSGSNEAGKISNGFEPGKMNDLKGLVVDERGCTTLEQVILWDRANYGIKRKERMTAAPQPTSAALFRHPSDMSNPKSPPSIQESPTLGDEPPVSGPGKMNDYKGVTETIKAESKKELVVDAWGRTTLEQVILCYGK